MATFFAALRRPAWGRRPRQSPGGQGRRVSPRQTIFKVVGSRPDGRVRVSPRGRVPFCVDKKEPKNHLGAQIGLASGPRASLARRICPLRTPERATGASVGVRRRLSGGQRTTARAVPSTASGLVLTGSGQTCAPRGRLPGHSPEKGCAEQVKGQSALRWPFALAFFVRTPQSSPTTWPGGPLGT